VTRSRAPKTHGHPRLAGARIVALAAFAMLPARGEAEPRPVDARIVWARADRAYIAAADSIALAPGDVLTVMKGKKSIAEGQVLQVLAHDLAAARITSGSLDRAKLDRLRILAERPPLRALPLLRIGYPGRGNSLFDCTRAVPHVPDSTAYHTDSLAENAYQLVRAVGAAPWPDTILVRLFADGFDEEIALERGELDIAVFWPGEPSRQLRADPLWQGVAYGSRGVLAARAPAGTVLSPDIPKLATLNTQFFRGDLAPWRPVESAPNGGAPSTSSTLLIAVDPSLPGSTMFERWLNAPVPPRDVRDDLHAARLFYIDSPAPPSDSLHVTPLFIVRCPIVTAPALRPYVAALGADVIAGMLRCTPARRGP
jgi:hypothetical protein